MKLLLDEMFSPVIAEQLRKRGHDVVSLHESGLGELLGAADVDVLAAALRDGRFVVTEDVSDFRRLEANAFVEGLATPIVIFATNRQFPRSQPGTLGRLVTALDALLRERTELSASIFLRSQ